MLRFKTKEEKPTNWCKDGMAYLYGLPVPNEFKGKERVTTACQIYPKLTKDGFWTYEKASQTVEGSNFDLLKEGDVIYIANKNEYKILMEVFVAIGWKHISYGTAYSNFNSLTLNGDKSIGIQIVNNSKWKYVCKITTDLIQLDWLLHRSTVKYKDQVPQKTITIHTVFKVGDKVRVSARLKERINESEYVDCPDGHTIRINSYMANNFFDKEYTISKIKDADRNLYQFKEAIAKPSVKLEESLEMIDIGGPTMIRAAAKNFLDVVVIPTSKYYDRIIEEMRNRYKNISQPKTETINENKYYAIIDSLKTSTDELLEEVKSVESVTKE